MRFSRVPHVLARFVRIRNTHVFSDERPSKRTSPSKTAAQVSSPGCEYGQPIFSPTSKVAR